MLKAQVLGQVLGQLLCQGLRLSPPGGGSEPLRCMSLSQSLPRVSGGPMIGGIGPRQASSRRRRPQKRGTTLRAGSLETHVSTWRRVLAGLGGSWRVLAALASFLSAADVAPAGQLGTLRSIRGGQMAEDPFGKKNRGQGLTPLAGGLP